MRRACVASLGFALIVAALVGCGRFSFETREPWRRQAEEACLQAKHVQQTAYMSFANEIDGPGTCGITWPVRATAFAGGTVGLTSRQTLACPIIPSIDVWLTRIVQPAAELYLGTRVVDLRAGSYNCRGRNNQYGAKVSEHGYGNALDVMAFRLADGREVTVKGGWRGAAAEQDFLREVFVGACSYFTTVLGPGSDMFHYDHFHLDLARHDPQQRRRICKPIIKFEPRIGGEAAAPAPRAAPPAPSENFEADDDGYAVSSREPAAPSRTGSLARAGRSEGRPSALTDYMSMLGLGGPSKTRRPAPR